MEIRAQGWQGTGHDDMGTRELRKIYVDSLGWSIWGNRVSCQAGITGYGCGDGGDFRVT